MLKNRILSFSIICFLSTCFALSGCNANSSTGETTQSSKKVEQKKGPAKIEIVADGYQNGIAVLIGMFTGQQYVVDSATINANGSMVFERDTGYQEGMAFIMMPDKGFFPLMIGADQVFKMQTVKGSMQDDMKVTGCIDNELYYENAKFEKLHQAELTALDKAASDYEEKKNQLVEKREQHLNSIFKKYPKSFFTIFKKAGQNPKAVDFRTPEGDLDTLQQIYTYRTQFWDNVDFNNDGLLYTPVISNKLKRYINELTAQNPDSIIYAADFLLDKVLDKKQYFKYIVNWIALNFEPAKSTLMDADAVYAHMLKNYFTTERAFWSNPYEIEHLQKKSTEMSVSLIGMEGANVRAKDQNGEFKAISDFTSDYVIVFMYSPSCDHCIEQSPEMVKFYKEWKNKGVEIYGIGTDTNQEEWEKFIKDYGLDVFTNVYDPTNKAIYKKYWVDITPEVYILNKDRKIIGKNLDVSQIATIIERDKKRN